MNMIMAQEPEVKSYKPRVNKKHELNEDNKQGEVSISQLEQSALEDTIVPLAVTDKSGTMKFGKTGMSFTKGSVNKSQVKSVTKSFSRSLTKSVTKSVNSKAAKI